MGLWVFIAKGSCVTWKSSKFVMLSFPYRRVRHESCHGWRGEAVLPQDTGGGKHHHITAIMMAWNRAQAEDKWSEHSSASQWSSGVIYRSVWERRIPSGAASCSPGLYASMTVWPLSLATHCWKCPSEESASGPFDKLHITDFTSVRTSLLNSLQYFTLHAPLCLLLLLESARSTPERLTFTTFIWLFCVFS